MKLHKKPMWFMTAAAAVMGLMLTLSAAPARATATTDCGAELIKAEDGLFQGVLRLLGQACLQGDAVDGDGLAKVAEQYADAWNRAIAKNGSACVDDGMSATSINAADAQADAQGLVDLSGNCTDLAPLTGDLS